jgi:hypothetical protein
VGRIHERFDVGLAIAVATALPATRLTIGGPVERRPDGWERLVALPNVRIAGPLAAAEARLVIARSAALVLLHRVDDYTRSQDAMKAWDAIASGTPVISPPLPPASEWPSGLAEVCVDTPSFIQAAARAVRGELDGGRAARSEFAERNQWSDRASHAIDAIMTVLGRLPESPGRD